MATTTKTVQTLDIKFHINDGTVNGDSLIWKFNDPAENLTLLKVKRAFGYNEYGSLDPNENGFLSYALQSTPIIQVLDKTGNPLDGIDSAVITTVVTTKNELE